MRVKKQDYNPYNLLYTLLADPGYNMLYKNLNTDASRQ
jgi:hypothetical protein